MISYAENDIYSIFSLFKIGSLSWTKRENQIIKFWNKYLKRKLVCAFGMAEGKSLC